MGNRSTPSSPGMVRAPPMSTASPSTMSPDTLGFHRARPRPTSWDSTKEIKPLYLLDPSRRPPPSQSTDSEIQSPVAEDAAQSTQIESLMHASEVTEEIQSSEVRNFAEEPQLESSETHLQATISTATLPRQSFQTLQLYLPYQKVGHRHQWDEEHRSLIFQASLRRQKAGHQRLRTVLISQGYLNFRTVDHLHQQKTGLFTDSDLATAGLLTSAALGLSTGAMALASSHDEPVEAEESAPKPTFDRGATCGIPGRAYHEGQKLVLVSSNTASKAN